MSFLMSEPVPPGFEDEIATRSAPFIKKQLEEYKNGALLGTEYAVELHEQEQSRPNYHCVLCNVGNDSRAIIAHLTSVTHRINFIKAHFSKAFAALKNQRKVSNVNANITTSIAHLAKAIEHQFGRNTQITAMSGNDFRRFKSKIDKEIREKTHFHQSSNIDLVDQARKIVLNPDYRPGSGDGGFKSHDRDRQPSAPVTATAGNSAESILLDSISSDEENFGPLDSKKGNNRRQSEQIGTGGGSHRIANRSPPPPHGGGGGGGGGNDKNANTNGNFKVSTPNELSIQASQFAQVRYKGEKFRALFEIELKSLRNETEHYETNPEKHPDYPEEWKQFWNRRYKQLQEEKKCDPNRYDYKPEWIAFWKKRRVELFNMTVNKIKKDLKMRFQQPDEDDEKTIELMDRFKITEDAPRAATSPPPSRGSSKESSSFNNSRKQATTNNNKSQTKRNASVINVSDEDIPSPPRHHNRGNRYKHSLSPSPKRGRPGDHQMQQGGAAASGLSVGGRSRGRNDLRSNSHSRSRSNGRSNRSRSPRNSRDRERQHDRVRSGRDLRGGRGGRQGSSVERSNRDDHRDLLDQRGSGGGPSEKDRKRGDYHSSGGSGGGGGGGGGSSFSRSSRPPYEPSGVGERYRVMEPSAYPEYNRPQHHHQQQQQQQQRRSVSPPVAAKTESDDPFNPKDQVTVVSVLRMLSVMEDTLGSLGPNVLTLLSKALAMEKVRPNSAEDLMLIEDNCVFLETIKEKLRGILIAEVLDDPQKIRMVKKLITNIAAVIFQTAKKSDSTEVTATLLSLAGSSSLAAATQVANTTATTAAAAAAATTTPSTTLSNLIENNNKSLDYKLPYDRQIVASKLAAELVSLGHDSLATEDLNRLVHLFTLLAKMKKTDKTRELTFTDIKIAMGLQSKDEQQIQQTITTTTTTTTTSDKDLNALLKQVEKQLNKEQQQQQQQVGSGLAPGNIIATTTQSSSPLREFAAKPSAAAAHSDFRTELLTDSDLQTLLQNFKFLSTDEQAHLTVHICKMEEVEPERVDKLRKFIFSGRFRKGEKCSEFLRRMANEKNNGEDNGNDDDDDDDDNNNHNNNNGGDNSGDNDNGNNSGCNATTATTSMSMSTMNLHKNSNSINNMRAAAASSAELSSRLGRSVNSPNLDLNLDDDDDDDYNFDDLLKKANDSNRKKSTMGGGGGGGGGGGEPSSSSSSSHQHQGSKLFDIVTDPEGIIANLMDTLSNSTNNHGLGLNLGGLGLGQVGKGNKNTISSVEKEQQQQQQQHQHQSQQQQQQKSQTIPTSVLTPNNPSNFMQQQQQQQQRSSQQPPPPQSQSQYIPPPPPQSQMMYGGGDGRSSSNSLFYQQQQQQNFNQYPNQYQGVGVGGGGGVNQPPFNMTGYDTTGFNTMPSAAVGQNYASYGGPINPWAQQPPYHHNYMQQQQQHQQQQPPSYNNSNNMYGPN